MKSNEIHILWSDYLHEINPGTLVKQRFQDFFSILTLVEDPRVATCPPNVVALVRSTIAKYSPKAFVASLRQLLRYISSH